MIKRIKICDFKSIRELELNLDPVTVLVGRGGTGKSNLVQAIRFLRNLLIDHPQAINYEGGWQRIVPVGEKNPKTSIEAVFSMPGEGQDYTYRTVFGTRHGQQFAGTLELITEHLALGNEMLFSRSWSPRGWDWPKAPDIAVMPHPADSPMLGSFPSLQKVVFAYAGLTSGIGYYHFPSTTLEPVQELIPSSSGKQSVVPLREKGMFEEVKLAHLTFGDFDVGRVVFSVQSAADGQAGFGSCGANQANNR